MKAFKQHKSSLIIILVLIIYLPLIIFLYCKNDVNFKSTQDIFNFITLKKDDNEIILFNNGWSYLENNSYDPEKTLNLDVWVPIDIPHTWNATDTVDQIPGYRRSASWYKNTFIGAINKRQIINFEGANTQAQIYINNVLAGTHSGGYIGFDIDVTPYIKPGKINEILVRVSNQYNPDLIPSNQSDFYIYGGIIRDIWIKTVPEKYISNVKITTPSVSKDQANTEISVVISGESNIKYDDLSINVKLINPNGDTIQERHSKTLSGIDSKINLDTLKNPSLWSPDSPSLYSVTVELRNKGETIHKVSSKFGYRWFKFSKDEGFILNGERLLLRGTHRHEESAGVGAAMQNSMHWNDMKLIKEMGANFVRLAHYPQDPEIYKAADELGILVWDELPWCRGGMGGKNWKENTRKYLINQINQNFNHPSIVFWSLGNEIDWESDFKDESESNSNSILEFVRELNSVAKSLDPYRLTSIRKYYPAASVVDVFSPSIWAGWYGGAYGQYEDALSHAQSNYPNFIHMEYGGDSHAGRHTENPIGRDGLIGYQLSVAEAINQASIKSVALESDWNENYMVNLFDWHLHISETFPALSGNAQWAIRDFATPLRPENPIPYINQKGLFDRSGNPKDSYYVFASYWSKKPFCYIESKSWTHREGDGSGKPVKVFCNTVTAELFLNGKSLGIKIKDKNVFPAGGLVWSVPFINGKNELYVEGRINETLVTDKSSITFLSGHHGPLNDLRLTNKIIDKGRFLIEAEAIDKDGNRVLNFSERAYFSNVAGTGQLVENMGSPTGSSVIEMANGYAAIEFLSDGQESVIEFRSNSVKGRYLKIRSSF